MIEQSYWNYNRLFYEMKYGKDHMFILGEAGSGKSELILNLCMEMNGIACLAPSGVAALRISGYTIHYFFGLRPTVQLQENAITSYYKSRINRDTFYVQKNIDTLLIDEISMVRCDLLDEVDYQLRQIRGNDSPFGGARMIFVGDIFQLSCVVRTMEILSLSTLYPESAGDFSFYNSKVFKNPEFLERLKLFELKFNFRQSGNYSYGRILSNIRFGNYVKQDMDILNKRIYSSDMNDDYHFLTTTREAADFINRTRLEKLDDDVTIAIAWIINKNNYNFRDIRDDCSPLPRELPIKKGAKIMMAMNDSSNERRWVNGTIGFIVDKIFKNDYLNEVVVRINKNGESRDYNVRKAACEIYKPIYNEPTKQVSIELCGKIIQFPFIISWANTIHKTQSLTLDNAVIGLGGNVFSDGQLYVALGRVPSLDNIYLTREINYQDIRKPRNALRFYDIFVKPKVKPVFFDLNDAKQLSKMSMVNGNYNGHIIEKISKIFGDGLCDEYISETIKKHPDFYYQ